jgi:hypothetical protein
MPSVRFEDFCEDVPDHLLPPLDRKDPGADIELTPDAEYWRQNGYLVLPRLLPDELIRNYCDMFRAAGVFPGGWPSPQPYIDKPAMRDLCCFPPLLRKIEELIPTPMAVSLALTAWISTTRTWHQDEYLNPPYMNAWYLAVWMALDDIDPDCGVFEFVPGSHRWPLMRGEKIRAALPPDKLTAQWPLHAEEMVTPVFDAKITESGLPIRKFLAKKGDVLIWHGRLAHRGSLPKVKGMVRPALIAHYSSIVRRIEMPLHRRHKDWGYYTIYQPPQ